MEERICIECPSCGHSNFREYSCFTIKCDICHETIIDEEIEKILKEEILKEEIEDFLSNRIEGGWCNGG